MTPPLTTARQAADVAVLAQHGGGAADLLGPNLPGPALPPRHVRRRGRGRGDSRQVEIMIMILVVMMVMMTMMMVARFFNDWVDQVKAEIPAERLLVFEVKQGWGPLCQFLGEL